MQTVIGSLIIATKAVHFGEFLAELDSQLSLAYKRKLFKSRKLPEETWSEKRRHRSESWQCM
jgi:hypothetical protein